MPEFPTFDELTGLPAYRPFVQTLGEMTVSGALCGVMLLDIDRFGLLNNAEGHGKADQALVAPIASGGQGTEVRPSAELQPDAEIAQGSVVPADDFDANSPEAGVVVETLDEEPSNVELTEAEVEFMTELACFAGDSPRRLIRFMNIYQLMKATLLVHEEFSVEKGDFCELMTQVAIVTGAPDLMDAWHEFLVKAKGDIQVEQLRSDAASEGWNAPSFQCLDGALSVLQKRRSFSDAAGLRTYSALSRRFSFGSALGLSELDDGSSH